MNRLANTGLALWLALDAARCFRMLDPPLATATDDVLGAALLYLAWCAARRPAPSASRTDPLTWAVVVASMFVPALWLAVPLPPGYDAGPGVAIRWLGTLGIAWSSLSLSGSFSILPQARQVVRSGPYRFVRHPMYASYLLLDAAGWFPHGSASGAALWVVEVVLLATRATFEEECLCRASEEYRLYRERVRSGFLPGVF